MLDVIVILNMFKSNPPSKLYRTEAVVPYNRQCAYVCTRWESNTDVLLRTTLWDRMIVSNADCRYVKTLSSERH